MTALLQADRGAIDWDGAMRRGDFGAAWAVSDAVLAGRDLATRDDPRLPYHERWVWDGRALAGRRVLVRCYHGLGDTLQFCRYLAPLRGRAAFVTLEVQAELVGLLAGMADRVVAFDGGAPLPPDEVDVEIMELGHALRLAPGSGAYLAVAASGVRGVGVCWQAGGWDPGRSVPLGALAGLAGLVPWVSLQRGAAVAEGGVIGACDPLEGSMDLGRMAGLVAGLDAVVTVDTMIAHLAGALGRPTLVLLKAEADWRWGKGEGCAWYGSVRTARQRVAGDWSWVAGEVRNYLSWLR